MNAFAFPIIIVSDGSVLTIVSEDALMSLLAISTDKAINNGFYSRAWIVDSRCRAFRVKGLRLSKVGVFGWLARKRSVEAFETEPINDDVPLEEIKRRVVEAVESERDIWSTGRDVDLLEKLVTESRTLDELIKAFGSEPIAQ